ncbi:unnamed protein product [Meganyctiphanes norvegica]|uniref:DZIP3-like HEPN domain-containing protein n=1 Tax=Meganyctiphanes norvegica TaxID=48144 RepID=A0AAV2QHL4_MEGNR
MRIPVTNREISRVQTHRIAIMEIRMKFYIQKHLRKSLYEELINDIGKYVLATVFVWTFIGDLSIPHAIRQTVLNTLGNNNTQYKKEFSATERSMLDSDTSPYKMDITILYKLLTIACTLAPKNSDLWTQKGHGGTHSLEFDLNAVKKLRNELAHERPTMTKDQFLTKITNTFNLYSDITQRAGVHSHMPPKEISDTKWEIEQKVNKIRNKYTTITYYLNSMIVLILAVITLIIVVVVVVKMKKEIVSENIDTILGSVIDSNFDELQIKESVSNLTKFGEWRITQGPKLEAIYFILQKITPKSIIINIDENPTSLSPYLNDSLELLCTFSITITLRLKFNFLQRISEDNDDGYLPQQPYSCHIIWLQGHFTAEGINQFPSTLKSLMLRISSDDMEPLNNKLEHIPSLEMLSLWVNLDVNGIPDNIRPLHYAGQELRLIINGNVTLTDDLIESTGHAIAGYIAKLCPPNRLGGLDWLGFTYTNLTGKGVKSLLKNLHESGIRSTGHTGGTVGLGISTTQVVTYEERKELIELAEEYGFVKYYHWFEPL